MFTYKAPTLRTLWIYIASFGIMSYTILQAFTLYYLLKKEKHRARIDKEVLDWARRITSIVKINLTIKYHTPINWEPHKRYVILSNHASLYDIPLIYLALPPSIRMLAKKELRQIPFFGTAMERTGFLFIDRNNLQKALQDLEFAKQQLQNGIKLWMAPEGTRSRSGKLLPFKKGPFMVALQTNAIIIPVGIRGSNKVLPPKSLRFNLNQNVEVHIGEPIDTTDYSIETRDLLINRVRHIIAELSAEKLEEEK